MALDFIYHVSCLVPSILHTLNEELQKKDPRLVFGFLGLMLYSLPPSESDVEAPAGASDAPPSADYYSDSKCF